MISIEVRSKAACADDEICRFAKRRLTFALDRFRNLRRIILSLEDVNGPKGGPDKLCRIVAVFGFATVIVEEIRSSWESSVALAIRRVARKAARELEKVNRSPLHAAHRTAFKAQRFQGDAPEMA